LKTRNYRFMFLILILFIFSGCAGSRMQTYLPYNTLARYPHHLLQHDGYIIGIEKRVRDEIGDPEDGYPDRFIPVSHQKTSTATVSNEIRKRDRVFLKVTNDCSAMLVTHIDSHFNGQRKFNFNAYTDYKRDIKDYKLRYKDGYDKALISFRNNLEEKLKLENSNGKPYSHILVFAMGWNNDQYESIWRYNKIVEHLKKVSKDVNDTSFKPLVIGFTWPSVWYGIEDSWVKKKLIGFIFSYFNKANDADEIGYTIANWTINNIVLNARDTYYKEHKKDLKIIAIGHSLGARMLSRAIFSDEYIKPSCYNKATSEVDLFIGLQGAFSAHRFIEGKGWEGYPYSEFYNRSTVFALTSSIHDKANPKVRFVTGARHVGGRYGLNKAIKHTNVFKVIDEWKIEDWKKDDIVDQQEKVKTMLAQMKREQMKVIMVDASSILVDDDSRNPPDAHNDILDKDMAKLIWVLIKGLP